MNTCFSSVLAILFGAAGSELAVSSLLPSPVRSIRFECHGCAPDGGLRIYTWRTAGSPPTPFWDQVGGTLTYTRDDASCKRDAGQCHVVSGNCVPNDEDKCESVEAYTITGGGLLNRFSHNASGCKKFGDLTAAERSLVATAKTCDGQEQQDIFFAYMSTTCAGPSLNDEKWVAWAVCSKCVD